jgi:iron complex outermembrane receptor protein
MSLRLSLHPLVLGPWSLVLLSTTLSAQAPKPATDEPVTLDRFSVAAEKENNFSLPLDALVTSGSRLGLTSRDLPASVSIITQEMMQLRGLRTAVEAVEAAVGMTGGTNFGSIPTYSTRGFGGNNVTVMRDGIRQNTASQASRTVDSFILDRIEVLKGPDGLMFGEGAIGGAVNYISKSPSADFRGDAMASYGAWGSYRAGLGVGGPLGKSGVNVRADYSHNQTYAYQERNSQRYDAVALSLAWRATDKLSLTWFGTFLDDWNESYYGNPVIYDAVVNTTVANASARGPPLRQRHRPHGQPPRRSRRPPHQLQLLRQLRDDRERLQPRPRRSPPRARS